MRGTIRKPPSVHGSAAAADRYDNLDSATGLGCNAMNRSCCDIPGKISNVGDGIDVLTRLAREQLSRELVEKEVSWMERRLSLCQDVGWICRQSRVVEVESENAFLARVCVERNAHENVKLLCSCGMML